MEDRPAKLVRLQALRDRLPYISQKALAAVLRIAQKEPLPAGRRNDFRDARDSVASTPTPYGPICQVLRLPSADGGTDILVEIQHPFAMFYHACKTSHALSALVKRCALARPPNLATPWNMIIYTDEITPGNPMAYKNPRKLWAIYWSILEWGPAVLSDEDTTWIACSMFSRWERLH